MILSSTSFFSFVFFSVKFQTKNYLDEILRLKNGRRNLPRRKNILSLPKFVPSVAEWSKALESDATAGGESPVRAPVRAATLCPYA